jgi:colanic acid biosynthesis glycosyl transferase WcaI
MNILILSMFYSPEPVARSYDLALALHQAGHKVRVVTAFPNYPHGKIYPGYRLRLWQWQVLDGVQVLRVPHYIDRSYSAIRRLFSYASFSISSLFLGSLLISKPDVIWTYQIGLPGVGMSALRGVPLVHEVQDLWPEWGKVSNLGIKGGLYRILEWQERMLFRRAKVVVTITNGFKSILMQKGVPAEKIAIIQNWANESTFRPLAYDPVLAREEGFEGYFNILYVGNVGVAQSLKVVLDAAELLKTLPQIRFIIIGDGLECASLEAQVRQRGLKNVRFLGSRPQHLAANYMALADVLFLHLKRDPVYAITIPSKTYGYLAAAKPILAAAEGELASLVAGLGAGVVCPPEDAPALADAVRQLVAMSESERSKLGLAGYKAVTTEYSRATLGKRYIDLFEKIDHENSKRPKNV